MFMEAGGLVGVFNVIDGLGEEVGKALALHNDVDKIGFTWLDEVGKLMMVDAGQLEHEVCHHRVRREDPADHHRRRAGSRHGQ